MNDAEIMKEADKALKELEQDINAYQLIAWGIPWDMDAVDKMKEIIAFYEKRKGEWLRMLSGASEITRNTLIEFMRLADLEIEGAESVLYMIQGGSRSRSLNYG